MTIYRNPVPGSKMRHRLPCLDFNPDGSRRATTCRDAFAEHQASGRTKFRSSNGGFECPGGCPRGDFCYPRHAKKGKTHFHQGIDLGAPVGHPIVSVSDGVVSAVPQSSSYGLTVAIRSTLPDGRQVIFFYAHCSRVHAIPGRQVVQQQVIAEVGATGNVGTVPPHLHFEVVKSPGKVDQVPTVVRLVETTLETPGPRLDPLEVLEMLGPWGTSFVALPNAPLLSMSGSSDDPRGQRLEPHDLALAHAVIAQLPAGQFPLGANNTWHGGVHLPLASPAQMIVAPFDGEIVALRLGEDASSATGLYGSTNFLLLRHQLSEFAARMFMGKHPTDDDDPVAPGHGRKKQPPASVGPGGSNTREDVVAVKHALRNRFDGTGAPYYAPADPDVLMRGETDGALFDAIERFQDSLPRPKSMKKSHPWPDGVITKGGYTWHALFGEGRGAEGGSAEAPPSADAPQAEGGDTTEPDRPALDPKRTVYALLMHLGPSSLGAHAKLPWVTRAKVDPRPGNADEEAIARAQREREQDEAQGRELTLKHQVGFPRDAPEGTAAGESAEIAWVQKRLIRFGHFGGQPDGVWSEGLRDAIAAFQREYVDYYAGGEHGDAPGYVTPKGDTAAALRKPKWKLDGEAAGGTIDPLFAARVAHRDEGGRAEVVSGLAIPVRSGEPLWPGGQVALAIDGSFENEDQIHFELFSGQTLTNWQELVDATEDLVVDEVPDALFEAVEIAPGFAKDRRLEAGELRAFYADARSHFLRRTQCRFRSEWAVDIPAWLRRLDEIGVDTSGVREALEAHVLWDAAADVLPPSWHVWHYHPVEFLGRYAEILEILEPREPAPPGRCRVDIAVRFGDGQPWSGARVQLAMVGHAGEQAMADVHGVARFYEVDAGSGIAFLEEHVDAAAFVDVDEDATTVSAELVAPISGPEVSTATLDVRLVGAAGVPLVGAAVVLVGDASVGPVESDALGMVTFESLAPGEYAATCGAASSPTLELYAGTRTEVLLELGGGAIEVAAAFASGEPAAQQRVCIRLVEPDDLGPPNQEGLTDAGGFARFDVLAGRYDVWVHGIPDAFENVEVDAGATAPVALIIPIAPVPTPEVADVGAIDVFVLDALGLPRADALVWLLDDANQQLTSARTDGGGRCRFDELVEGTYGVSAEHGKADELGLLVSAGASVQVAVHLGAPAKPAKPTGSLLVTVVYDDGADFDGTLVITRRDYTRLVSDRMTGSFRRFDGVEAGPINVYVDGFEVEIRIDLPADADVPILLLLPGSP